MSLQNETAFARLLDQRALTLVPGAAAGADALEELLIRLHAPSTLFGAVKVARNLRRIFRNKLRADMDSVDHKRLGQYSRELRWLVHNAEALAVHLHSDKDDRALFLRENEDKPLRWGYQIHGLWFLLWHDHPNPELLLKFRALQGNAVDAHIAVMNYWTGRPEWKIGSPPATTILSGIYREKLAIRHFVMDEFRKNHGYDKILSDIPAGGPIPITIERL